MTNPRIAPSVVGVDAKYNTFIIDDSTITYDADYAGGSAQVGLAVRLLPGTANAVELVGDGEAVLGKLIKVEADNRCTVQTHGGMALKAGTAATLTIGKKIVGDLLVAAEGYIREVADPTTVDPTLAQLLELNASRGMIVNPDTTTAVEVIL
jgi:hypothetical protein